MKRTPIHLSWTSAAAWLAVALCGACQEAPTAAAAASLQGYWERGDTSVHIAGDSLFFYEREDHWFDTKFTLPVGTHPKQLHATIRRDSSGTDDEVGTVVAALFEVEDGTLTLLAYGAEEEPPGSFDDDATALGRYDLERAEPREGRVQPPGER